MLASGVLIDERHEIEQLLGRGGMAEVFRAKDITTDRSVAVKLLRAVDPLSFRRFRSEIEVLSRLDHPGVVRLRGTGSHDGIPYLVLDLVDGPPLADVLDSGPLGIEQSISIGQQLAEALTHAHGLDIVHRDVKPANVIFDAERARVCLTDFGIALFGDTTRMTATGKCIGTVAYLAPEQLEGHVGPAADVYALGLIVLECLTGARCYAGTVAETAMARLHRPPVVPVDLPAWLGHTLRAMTARHPGRRPPAQAVADAFRRRSVDAVLASTVEVDRGITSPQPDAGTSRRSLALAFGGGALTTIAAMAVLALSLMTTWPFGDSGVQTTEQWAPSNTVSTTVERELNDQLDHSSQPVTTSHNQSQPVTTSSTKP